MTGGADGGAGLPAATRLGPVRLQVADLGRSREWYSRVLGLQAADETSGRTMLTAADRRPLVELRERPGAHPMPRRGRLGLYHYAILLPDRRSLGGFVAHLAGQPVRVGSADHLVSEALYLNDPDGLGIEVYADRPRAEWRQAGGEIAMATDPLDVAALVEAAGDEPWGGMPAGTVIGHVHLHVGSIPEAGAFYADALGFDRTVTSYPGALFLAAGGYHHHLGTNTWAGSDARAPGEDDARLVEWTLELPDAEAVHAAAKRLERKGYPVRHTDGAAVVQDPWGTAVRLIRS